MTNKISESNNVIRASAWYTISNFSAKAVGFLTVPIFTRLLTKTEVGAYDNILVWMEILYIVISLCVSSSVNRARFDYPGKINEFCSTILLTGSVITACVYGIVVLKLPFFETLLKIEGRYIHLMFLYIFFYLAFEIFSILQRVQYHYKLSAALSFLMTFLPTVVSVILVTTLGDRLAGRTIGHIVPIVVLSAPLYVYLIVKGKAVVKLSYFKYAFLYSWPFILHLLALRLLNTSDRIMIVQMIGEEANAIYGIAHSCVSIASLFLTSLNTAISPWVFDQLEAKDYQPLRKITIPYVGGFAILVHFIMLFAPEILLIIGGPAYVEATSCFVPLFTSIVVQFCYCMYVNVEQYAKKTWTIAFGTAIAALVNIVLNYLLIPVFGYVASAYTTLVGYLVLFFVHFCFVRIIGYKHIYNDKWILLIMGFTILLQPLILVLYKYAYIRYAFIVVEFGAMLFYAIRKKEVIIAFVNKRLKKNKETDIGSNI